MAHLTKAPNEIITGLAIPPVGAQRATYSKLRRREGIHFPILGVAAAIELDDDGVRTAARIVLGAVASAPLRVPEAEETLVGRPFTADTSTECVEAARKLARPLNNTDLTSRYRKRMIPVFVTRALEDLRVRSESRANGRRLIARSRTVSTVTLHHPTPNPKDDFSSRSLCPRSFLPTRWWSVGRRELHGPGFTSLGSRPAPATRTIVGNPSVLWYLFASGIDQRRGPDGVNPVSSW